MYVWNVPPSQRWDSLGYFPLRMTIGQLVGDKELAVAQDTVFY